MSGKRFNQGTFLFLMSVWLFNIGWADELNVSVLNCTGGNITIKKSKCGNGLFNITNDNVNVHILQRAKKWVIPGVICHIYETQHSYYCGAYAHLHLAKPTQINRPMLISADECAQAYKSGIIIIRGIPISVKLKQQVKESFLINGTIYFRNSWRDGFNPQCEGKGILVGNTFVPSSFIDTEITISIKTVDLIQTENGCIFNDIILATDNETNRDCGTPHLHWDMSRIIALNETDTQKRYYSGFRTVKILNASILTHSEWGEDNILYNKLRVIYNEKHSLAVEMGDKQIFGDVLPGIYYYITNVEGLYVWITHSIKEFFPFIHRAEIDANLEDKFYLSYGQYNNLINEHNDCTSDSVILYNLVKAHKGRIQRTMGEIILEQQCVQVRVKLNISEKLPCFVNHFAVTINGSIYGIVPNTRLLVNKDHLIEVDCNFNPTYISVNRNVYAVNTDKGINLVTVTEGEIKSYTFEDLYGKVIDEQADQGETSLISLDVLKLQELAHDAIRFKPKVEMTWVKYYVNKISGWVSTKWHEILMYMAGGLAAALSVCLVGSMIYLCCCAKIFKVNNTQGQATN